MMTLREQQHALWSVVTGQRAPEAVAGGFRGSAVFSATARLRVYRDMYLVRLGQALERTFPALERTLGTAAFRKMAKAYLRTHPSEDPRIELVGRALPAFLAAHPDPDLRASVPTAALDWARAHAVVAADPESVASVRQIDPRRFAEQRLTFIPSLSVVRTDTRQWRAVWRRNHRVTDLALPDEEGVALDSAVQGALVAAVCEGFGHDDAVERAYRTIASWFARGWIADLVDPGEKSR